MLNLPAELGWVSENLPFGPRLRLGPQGRFSLTHPRSAGRFIPDNAGFSTLFGPLICPSDFLFGTGGTFDLLSKFLILSFLLNATSGGSGKMSFQYLSCESSALQCLAWMAAIDGSLGSYFNANIGRLILSCLFTLCLSAFWLGTS